MIAIFEPVTIKDSSIRENLLRPLLAIVLALSLALPLPVGAHAAESDLPGQAGTLEMPEMAPDSGQEVEKGTTLEKGSEPVEESSHAAEAEEGRRDDLEGRPEAGASLDKVLDGDSEPTNGADGAGRDSVGHVEPNDQSQSEASGDNCVAGEIVVVYDDAGEVSRYRSFGSEGSTTLYGKDIQVIEEIAPASDGSGTIVAAQVPSGKTVHEVIADLEDAPGIAYAQPNFEYRLIDGLETGQVEDAGAAETGSRAKEASAWSVDDPLCNNSFASNANQYYLYETNTVQAWDAVQGNKDVTVAVIDTGCRLDHEDLAGVVDVANAYDAVQGKRLSESSLANGDSNGHGTHVSGVAGAQANNGIGIAGASYNARILPINVFNGSTAQTTDIIKALKYLKDLMRSGRVGNLRVVNLSLGYYPKDQKNLSDWDRAFESAIVSLREEYGVLTVCAGGNGDSATGEPLTDISLPSDFDACLAVTSIDRGGKNTYWSDYNAYKDISAPGVSITSTSSWGPNQYRMLDGTSMASPLVSGIAALLWSVNPDLTVDQVVAAIENTADPIHDSQNDRAQTSGSHGAINARAAIDYVSKPEPAASLNVSHGDIAGLTYGYAAAVPITFSVRNTGTAPVGGIRVAMEDGSSSFDIGSVGATTLAPGSQTTFTCTLKPSLNAGTYTGKVRVYSGESGWSVEDSFSQTIEKLDISSGKLYEWGALSPGVSGKDWSGKACVLEEGWTVKAGGLTFVRPHVALSYRNNVDVGNSNSAAAPMVTVSAANPNLIGTFSVKFSISKVSHWERLGGTTAFDTMALISQEMYPQGSGTVIIATYDGYWDALTASGLAAFEKAPILLTRTAGLDAVTAREIRRLKARRAVVVGGEAVVSEKVKRQLEDMKLTVERRSGYAADDTAIDVYNARRNQWGTTAIVATSQGYWDALSIAPFSYAKKAPIFLAQASDNGLSSGTLAAIRDGGFTRVVIAGGRAVVSSNVETQLSAAGVPWVRVWGDTAAQTSAKISEFAIGEGMSARYAGVATLDGHWDALTGAVLCGKNNSILMLASGSDTFCIDRMISLSRSSAFLTSRKANLQHGYIFGGQVVVPPSTANRIEDMYVGL